MNHAIGPGGSQARIQGGGARVPCPPPIFWGKNKGAKNHTQTKKRSKSDNHEARYRLKRTKNTLNTLKFSKKIIVRWGGGGLRGHKGKYFVHKSNKE